MNALMLLVATAAVGVDFGWQPLSDGGVEYIIQIEPQWVDSLAAGHEFSSGLPPGLDVRRFRITVGTAKLPQIAPAPPVTRPNADRTSDTRRSQPAGPTAPPVNAEPMVAAPALAAPAAASAAGAASEPPLGPALGPPIESPAVIADRVSRALDDPNAPGRNPLPETPQPKLPANDAIAGHGPPRTLEPDPTSEQLAEYQATPHEAQRQHEHGEGTERGGGFSPGSDRADGERQPGEHAGSQFNASSAAKPNPREAAGAAAKTAGESSAEKSWPALIGTVLLLLISISANVFLVWFAWESRRLYRELLAEHGSSPMPV